jgi:hypothetical protein
MLIDKIKEDRNKFRFEKNSIKENILKLIESESSKLNKNPSDNEVFKVLNSIYQSNSETIELIKDNKDRVDETIKLVIENDLINSYFPNKIETVVNSINFQLIELGKEKEDLQKDKKSLGVIMKSLNQNFGEGFNRLQMKKFLGI